MTTMIDKEGAELPGNSVLVVDDDSDLCKILACTITKKCSVHCEHSLKTAEAYLHVQQPAIIFLDNNLPDGLGVASIKGILNRYPDVKIVLMTADTAVGLKEFALHEGAIMFVAKPFRGSLVNEIIFTLCPELRAA